MNLDAVKNFSHMISYGHEKCIPCCCQRITLHLKWLFTSKLINPNLSTLYRSFHSSISDMSFSFLITMVKEVFENKDTRGLDPRGFCSSSGVSNWEPKLMQYIFNREQRTESNYSLRGSMSESWGVVRGKGESVTRPAF